jgi:hypothetical protein
MPQVGILLVLVVNIKKDHTVVGDFAAASAMILKLFGLLATLLAPVINQPVIAPTDVFFEPTVMHPVHPTVGSIGIL